MIDPGKRARALAAVVIAASTAVAAAATERQHGAHVHGEAALTVVVDDDMLVAELESPAANIVGFEHRPQTDAERRAATDAEARLADSALLEPAAAAGCLAGHGSATATMLTGTDDDGHDDDGHDDDSHDDDSHDDDSHDDDSHDDDSHDDDSHDDDADHDRHGDDGEAHSEYLATWSYRCDDPAALSTIRVHLFTAFPGIGTIDVQWSTAGGQGAAELSADDPVIRF